jgi:amidase
MSNSLADLSLFMKVIIDSQPWLHEPALIPLPWTPFETLSHIHIRIGIMSHDGVVTPHPPITRALESLQDQLRSIDGIEIVPWHPHAHDEAWAIQSSLYFPDGGAADKATMAQTGEPILPLTRWMLEENPCVKKLSVDELFYWQEEREAYRTEYARLWRERGVDAVLCPVGPSVAGRHDSSRYWGYSAVWNLLDYPAAVFPVGRVDKKVDRGYERESYLSGKDEEEWKKCKWPVRAM